MKIILISIIIVISVQGCQSLDLRNSGGTITTTIVAYATGGIIPAVAVAGANLTYDAIVDKNKDLEKIKNMPQAVAYIADELISNIIIGIIIFLICITFCKPWLIKILTIFKRKSK